MVRSGQLRTPVRIEFPIEVTEESGQSTVSWEPLKAHAKDWAEIRPLSGMEAIRAQQLMGETAARIRMRYRSDLSETMRLIDTTNNEVWNFSSPPLDPTGQRLETEILATHG